MEQDESHLGVQTVKLYGESVGLSSVPEEAAKFLADEMSFILKEIIQDASKFMRHSKRHRLATKDIDSALRARKIEPLYGFTSTEYIPWRYASGGGRELHFNEDHEIDLQELINKPTAKVPAPIKVRAHWLVIEGVQPNIPENPAPVKKPPQELAIKKLPEVLKDDKKDKTKMDKKPNEKKNSSIIEQKPLLRHELSVEQMKYYQEITQAAVGRNEEIRKEALTSLSTDTGIHAMLPRFTNFISEGIKCNINENNLALVIYLMRMVKALLDNPTLSLDMYLHELIPVVISCVVSKQLTRKGENHWALRTYTARVLSQISRNFTTSTTMLQSRIVSSLTKPLNDQNAALPQVYGSLVGLSELGRDVVSRVILPRLRRISERLEAIENDRGMSDDEAGNFVDQTEIDKAIRKHVFPLLPELRHTPDVYEQYINDYGAYLGKKAYQFVTELRN